MKNNSEKHVPLRMCIVCRSMKPKDELVRLVNAGGVAVIDESKKQQTRGAYICRCEACIRTARRKHLLDRAFRAKQPESAYNDMEEYFLSIGGSEENS